MIKVCLCSNAEEDHAVEGHCLICGLTYAGNGVIKFKCEKYEEVK